jgi:hypothetical protein
MFGKQKQTNSYWLGLCRIKDNFKYRLKEAFRESVKCSIMLLLTGIFGGEKILFQSNQLNPSNLNCSTKRILFVSFLAPRERPFLVNLLRHSISGTEETQEVLSLEELNQYIEYSGSSQGVLLNDYPPDSDQLQYDTMVEAQEDREMLPSWSVPEYRSEIIYFSTEPLSGDSGSLVQQVHRQPREPAYEQMHQASGSFEDLPRNFVDSSELFISPSPALFSYEGEEIQPFVDNGNILLI